MSFSQQEIRTKVEEYIVEHFFFNSSMFSMDETTSFLENGIIDSTGVLELINFLQNEYGITIEDHEILPKNLDSLNAIAAYITDKLSAS